MGPGEVPASLGAGALALVSPRLGQVGATTLLHPSAPGQCQSPARRLSTGMENCWSLQGKSWSRVNLQGRDSMAFTG